MSSTTRDFEGMRVVLFEARRAGPLAELVTRRGGVPIEAPALRELPIEDNEAGFAFAKDLLAGHFDLVIFLTGVGTRYLAQTIETRFTREEWTEALNRTKVVVRGPKPVPPLRELKVRVDLQAPTPNTWREILGALDEHLPVQGLRVAVQEYGESNPGLLQGLQQRGAQVTSVPVYRWTLPEDTGPIRGAVEEIIAGNVSIALFTAAQQVVHLLQVAAEMGSEAPLREALESRVVIGSVGPTTSETLRERSLPVDVEPEQPKMGPLVDAAAAGWQATGKIRGR